MNIICIIPARGGSKRLPKKNIVPVLGTPMISYAIRAAHESLHIGPTSTYVSTEDAEIANVCLEMGAKIIERPDSLATDDTWTQDVLRHAVKSVEDTSESSFDLVVRVQANSPQVTSKKIDECIEKLIKNGLWEVFTVDQDGIEDAAVHVMLRRCVEQEALSVYKGVVRTNYIDIHDEDDVIAAEKIMNGDINIDE